MFSTEILKELMDSGNVNIRKSYKEIYDIVIKDNMFMLSKYSGTWRGVDTYNPVGTFKTLEELIVKM